ncbi:MAG: hypothetical protein KC656_25715, partial [Myxococcales bacterium]|nr:hypothetical protein [Myxococcales bacterium]
TPALEAALAGPEGASAADLLLLAGRLAPGHLRTLVTAHPDAATLPLWLATLAGDPDDVARSLESLLRADLEHGAPRLLACCELGARTAPDAVPRGLDALHAGCAAAGGSLPTGAVRGSAKRQVQGAVATLLADRPEALAALLRAANGLRKAPPLPPDILFLVGWMGTYDASAPLPVRLAQGADDPATVRRVRAALEAGEALDRPAGPGPAMVYDLHHARPLDPFDVRFAPLAGYVQGLRSPDRVAAMLEEPENRSWARSIAAMACTEEVLAVLLSSPVPADPFERHQVAWALASMATPAVDPVLTALLPHLEEDADRASVQARYAELMGRALA